jgi:hypothetical protein
VDGVFCGVQSVYGTVVLIEADAVDGVFCGVPSVYRAVVLIEVNSVDGVFCCGCTRHCGSVLPLLQ